MKVRVKHTFLKVMKRKSQPYNCNECDYKSNQKNFLRFHTEAKHDGIIYTCAECDLKFNSERRLKFHEQSKHE